MTDSKDTSKTKQARIRFANDKVKIRLQGLRTDYTLSDQRQLKINLSAQA
jgi:hypothetical protein